MFKTTFLDMLPMWGVFIGSVILIVITVEIGYALGRRKLAQVKDGEVLHMGGAVAATLGLLAFMLAFTFGSGTSRLDTKRQLVLQETNAIATTYLRTELLPEPHKTTVQQLLTEYVDQRLRLVKADKPLLNNKNQDQYIAALEQRIDEAEVIHTKLWAQAVAVAQKQPTPTSNLFISSLNELIDLHQSRVTIAIQQRMPTVFWFALYCLAFLAMGLAGYDAGVSRSSRNMSAWVVATAFSTVIVLVVGLDRPQTSAVDNLPLQELQKYIHAAQQRQ